MSVTPESVIETLKRAREQRGLDAEELSLSLGLHRFVIKDWEDGRRLPRATTLVRWARALGFDLQLHLQPVAESRRKVLSLNRG